MADPTQVNYTNTTIPDYAAPFVQNMLGTTQALTDTSTNPYQQYQGDRVAQFDPLQNQSFENAALMQPAPQMQDASALAGQAGLGALNTSYTYNPYQAQSFNDPGVAQSFMSPYMDNVVARQQQDATRQAAIASQTQGAQAAQAGAFGGSGDYLMRGQAAGNLARQQGDIAATGLQNAYTAGMGQFNAQQGQNQAAANLNAQQGQFGANLGMQGLQTANASAQNLATIGNAQYNQNMGINQLQNQYGTQQQQQVQTGLNNQYQDFLNYQNYPYKQLGFMSDMLRGLPLTQQSSTIYQAAPSTVSQVAGLGTAAVGAAQLMKADGGVIKSSYADGGQVQGSGLADLAIARMA